MKTKTTIKTMMKTMMKIMMIDSFYCRIFEANKFKLIIILF